jgi:CTP:molybdopterin cytidylyltransferase MocA
VTAHAAGAVGALILAAGRSARLGQPKQLLPLEGRPLLQHAVDAAAAAGLPRIVVVLGHAAERVAAALALPAAAWIVVAARHAEGQAASLAAGLAALEEEDAVEAALVLLGDQPTVSPAAIRAVAGAYRAGGPPILRASYGGRPGHPVLLARPVWAEAMALEGDRGARALIAGGARVGAVEVAGEPPPDVDTWEDWERLRARAGAAGAGAGRP